MAKYTVKTITPKLDQSTGETQVDNYGNKKYQLFVTDEAGQIHGFNKGYKGEPNKVGDILEGTIEVRTGNNGGTYNVFKADNAGGFTPRGGGYQSDPEEQQRIMRQHAVTDSLTFHNLLKTKDLTTKEVIYQAEIFMRYYNNGTKKPDNYIDPIDAQIKDALAGREPLPEPEINVDDVPF